MTTIILLSILGAVIAAVVGTFWYSPMTPMGKIHMQALGFDKLSPEEQQKKMLEAKPKMWKMYLGQMILSFLTAFAVVFIITLSAENGVPFGTAIWFIVLNWFCFMVPIIGSAILWSSDCDSKLAWKKFFSDILSNLVILVLVGFVTSLFV
ncbi:MAG: DUF1761 domain-containing protein [Candidatus Pacebacteria bacterium]|nr:DUF1761 domain-containing protein [Candidatus Paceibacterota bacterium]